MIKEVKGFIAIVVLGIVFGVINILIMYKNKDKKEKEFVRAILPIGIIEALICLTIAYITFRL